MTPIEGSASVTRKFIRIQVMGCFRCDNCQAPNIAVATGLPGGEDVLGWLARKKNKDWQPVPPRVISVKSFPDVPRDIASAASEAHKCRVSNAGRASILMARSVIEATAKDKGIKNGRLIAKIDQMHDKGLIRPGVRDGAHEIRHFGNGMAHGDFVHEVNLEDADLVLALMDEVLDEVYQSPARVARAKAAREEREALNAKLAAAATRGKQVPVGMSSQWQVLWLGLQETNPPAAPTLEAERKIVKSPSAGTIVKQGPIWDQ